MNSENEHPFASYRGKRDYRAILFTGDKLARPEQVAALFGARPLASQDTKHLPTFTGKNIQGARFKYVSANCFLRSANETAKRALLGTNGLYEYEVCVLSYGRRRPVFFVAVPFSSMAREVFGKLHNKKPTADFLYVRPSLDQLVEGLLAEKKEFDRIRVTGINWTIAGDTGRGEQITLRGDDVIHSRAFEHLRDPRVELSLSLRRVQIVHEGFGGAEKLKVTIDKFGNYALWVNDDGENLPDVFNLYEQFDLAKILQNDPAFPVRNREDEPLFP